MRKISNDTYTAIQPKNLKGAWTTPGLHKSVLHKIGYSQNIQRVPPIIWE